MSFLPVSARSHCQRCNGECEANKITVTLRRTASEFAILRNVPAEICQVCGETQFSMSISLQMLASLQTNEPPDDIAIVPVFDFCRAGLRER